MAKKFEIMTRIMSQANGSGKLKLTVKNGWSFWGWMYVENTESIRNYLKSDEFKEYAYSVFSKYEGMTYEKMHNSKSMRDADFKQIWEKLDRFAWRTDDEEPFKVIVDTKLVRTYSNGFRYRVVFSNNKDNKRCWYNKVKMVGCKRDVANEYLADIDYVMQKDKEFMDKLATYKTWDEFYSDTCNRTDISSMVNRCVNAA